ncbi:MAG: SDR family oxidoreductase [Hyphomicrobium sp.]|nr:SDR family oxidoreductase [Hyphomicrobium sp.]
MLLDNKVAVVTGGAKGIGYAIARRFLEEGARVMIADTDDVAGPRAATELGRIGRIRYFECDVSERLDVRNMVAATVDAFGDIDVLVNNAAILVKKDFLELDPDDFDRVLRVNLRGSFLCGQAVARHMVERIEAGGRPGAIINMSSVNALFAIPDQVPYSVSKAGLEALVKTYAHEVASTPIKVNLLNPGPVRTTMRQRAFPGENPATLPEPEALVPLFLDLVDAGQTESGRVYDFKTGTSK